MKSIKEILNEASVEYISEGVYDKNIFKAVFMAGGPGSGKSFVAGQSGLVDKDSERRGNALGFKVVNSDDLLAPLMKKAGLSLKMPEEEFEKREEIRKIAKTLTSKRFDLLLDGRLGLVIDGTARDYAKIKKTKDALEQLGYDTYMVFVNTSLENAMQQNKKRGESGGREVPEDIVVDSWHNVQKNMGQFQSLFGPKNFMIVDNNRSEEDRMDLVWGKVQKMIRGDVDNYIAKKWIQKELELKRKK